MIISVASKDDASHVSIYVNKWPKFLDVFNVKIRQVAQYERVVFEISLFLCIPFVHQINYNNENEIQI